MANFVVADGPIVDFFDKVGHRELHNQAMASNVLIKSGLIPEKFVGSKEVRANLSSGGSTSLTYNLDGGDRTYSDASEASVEVNRVLFTDGMKIGAEAIYETKDADAAIDMAAERTEQTIDRMGAALNRDMYQGHAATIAVAGLAADTAIEISQLGALKPDVTYEVFNSSDVSLGTITVAGNRYGENDAGTPTSLTAGPHAVDVVGTVGFTYSVGDTIRTPGWDLYANDKNKFFASIRDAAMAVPMYGQAAGGVYQWQGIHTALFGAMSADAIGEFEAVRYQTSQKPLGFTVMDPLTHEKYLQTDDGNRHVTPGGKFDARGYASSYFNSRPVLVDPAANAGFALIPEKGIELCVFREFDLDNFQRGSSKNSLGLFWGGSQETGGKHAYYLPFSGKYNLRHTCRQGTAFAEGVT